MFSTFLNTIRFFKRFALIVLIALFCLQSVSEAGAQDAPQIISLSASREYVKQWWVVGPFKRTGSPELLA
ncbi:TPA: hypothetical protein DDW35_11795, partial [Candidatus Sumerlaeota bacterium]|nr:hypothetical protein [Candidatus Sumerlaeota bacterium]